MLTNLKRIVVVVGHYGSGKTNFSVNLAVDLKAAGRDVILVDLDIVNPYFRSADFGALLEEKGSRPSTRGPTSTCPPLTGAWTPSSNRIRRW